MWIARIFFIFVTLVCAESKLYEPINYVQDSIDEILIDKKVQDSHIKVFIPSIPYWYVARLVNGSLLKLSDNSRGWEYMMAKSHKQIDKTTYEFYLRKEVKFQDGTPFDADSVIKNFNAFAKQPYTYTDIHNRLDYVEKIDRYSVRFHLKKPYGMFLNDLTGVNLYSDVYLEKFAWKGMSTGDSMESPGPYGLGPYMLTEGFVVGRKQTPKAILKANPYYYEEGKPYIEKVTIYTKLKAQEAVAMAVNGELDITPIPFNKKTEIVHSANTKLLVSHSTHNINNFFNLIKPNGILKEKAVRIALNKAIDQESLLNFVYKKEGVLSPTAASTNYRSISKATKDLKPHGSHVTEEEKKALIKTLSGVELNIFTQDRFMFMWRGIEYQLQEFGVKLHYTITSDEKDIYENLLTNRKEPKEWDILTWGNNDWFGNHPWTVFFTYRTSSPWSAIDKDKKLQGYLQELFEAQKDTKEYDSVVAKIVKRAYEQAYMLFVPSPNIVLAVNKEVYYPPSSVATMPLWEAKISKYHRSIYKKDYPQSRNAPFYPARIAP